MVYAQSSVGVGVLLLSVGAGLGGAVGIDQHLGPRVEADGTSDGERAAPGRGRHERGAESRAAARRDARAQRYYEDYARGQERPTDTQHGSDSAADDGKRPLLDLMGEVKEAVRWARRFIGRVIWEGVKD